MFIVSDFLKQITSPASDFEFSTAKDVSKFVNPEIND